MAVVVVGGGGRWFVGAKAQVGFKVEMRQTYLLKLRSISKHLQIEMAV